MRRMHADEVAINETLVRRLLASQMPHLADLPLRTVEPWGTDHAIWRLGQGLVLRFPRIHWAVDQVDLEATWLPRLAPHLPVAIPEPVAIGEPDEGYPYRWAVHRWLPGTGATLERMDDPDTFARDLAHVVGSLQTLPTAGAPPAQNRARPIRDYDESTRQAIHRARHLIDAPGATAIWEQALAAPADAASPVWVHGDLEGNCLLNEGHLSGLLDWGAACVGDPAVDIQVIWSPLFTKESRHIFLEALSVDDATIARSKGAAINQACQALPYYLHTYPEIVERSWHKLAVLGVHPQQGALALPERGARG